MKMKLSVWTSFFYGLTPEQKLEAFAECGYRYVELSSEDGEELLTRGAPQKTGEAYRKHAGNLGITVLQGHLKLGADILNTADRALLKVWLDLFEAVGVKYCVLHYGDGYGYTLPPEQVLQRRADALRELTEHIAGTDLYLCLENIHRKYDADCKNILSIIKAAGTSNLAVCLDTGHLNLAEGSQSQFITQAGTMLRALHIADNEGLTDQHIVPYGRGTVAWDEVMRALNASDYDGLFNYEVPGEISAPFEIRKAKLRYIKEMTQYMATLHL